MKTTIIYKHEIQGMIGIYDKGRYIGSFQYYRNNNSWYLNAYSGLYSYKQLTAIMNKLTELNEQ